MNFLSIIEAKRDGKELPGQAIQWAVREFTAGRIPDYQMSALLMAVFFRGMTPEETRALTLAMRDSGDGLRFPSDPRPVVDKHSTGGVGDKVSLALAPLLACLGFRVPMISGRGLGITGGTLDKLESIPGFSTRLTRARMVEQVQQIGVAMAGQSEEMVPADRLLYALRDLTGTVPSIPLITASILSKKLAEGLNALVLDVKFGSAAFMHTRVEAEVLARDMVNLGTACQVNTRALLSDMNTPLGRAAGNWLEVKEAVECLEGKGPQDLVQLVVECAASLLIQTGAAPGCGEARALARDELASRRPLRKWEELLALQGADLEAYHRRLKEKHVAVAVTDLKARRSGRLRRVDARVIGEVVRDLGGGRLSRNQMIEPMVGVDELKKPGEEVKAGEALCRVHVMDAARMGEALVRLSNAFEIEDPS